jgi:preprotein translocase subunit SecF
MERSEMMKLKKILIILMTLIVVVVVSTLLYYKNMNYISENWDIDFPSENTIVYQVKPSPSFTNDGIYYEVQEAKSKKLPITLSNKKNNEIEEEFNKYIIEAKVSQKKLPDFTQDYKYYKKSDVGRSLIVVAQRHKLYIVSYNL